MEAKGQHGLIFHPGPGLSAMTFSFCLEFFVCFKLQQGALIDVGLIKQLNGSVFLFLIILLNPRRLLHNNWPFLSAW